MNNVIKKTKIILFAGLLVALILPFSNFEMIDATTNEMADKIKDDSKENEKKDKEHDDDEKDKEHDDDEKDKEHDDDEKDKEHNYEKKSNYKEKDHHNHKADKILEKMSLLMQKMPNNNATTQKIEIEALQTELKKVTKEHKDKIIDKDLRKELKKARKLIINSGIPTKVLATGIDHLYIQLSKENAQYEQQIIKLMNNLPYKLEYGEGFKRSECLSTTSDCNYEMGGIQIQIEIKDNKYSTCSLSIPMKKDGVDGFLTAAHCFHGYSEDVYQPDGTNSTQIIGFSNSAWRSFVDGGECDCAWIQDTSDTKQISGIYKDPSWYWHIYTTHVPSKEETVKLRGALHNNGNSTRSNPIDYTNVVINGTAIINGVEIKNMTTINLMAFEAPADFGDSGGAVFYGSSYVGIVVGKGDFDGKMHAIFVPWNHITENISGLVLTPHP